MLPSFGMGSRASIPSWVIQRLSLCSRVFVSIRHKIAATGGKCNINIQLSW